VDTHVVGQFATTARITLACNLTRFWLTTFYGPVDDANKDSFLAELAKTAPPTTEPWLINGDFNLIYKARDKNNHNLNRRLMGRFR
uniref:Endonuclease/exonuclease/phosphatase domain-containing protein n=1 Tax=Aegilops tauschii subsp. strangulata TaxID=200361 RepID=A0A453K0Z4_AEGTS